MVGINCLRLIFFTGTVQGFAFFEPIGVVRCHAHTNCFQLDKSASMSMACRASLRSSSSCSVRTRQLGTACNADGADDSSNEPILEWSLPSGPPLRIISVSEAEHTDNNNSPRDLKISAANGWGDGQHATTRLCLSFLAENAGPNKVLRPALNRPLHFALLTRLRLRHRQC